VTLLRPRRAAAVPSGDSGLPVTTARAPGRMHLTRAHRAGAAPRGQRPGSRGRARYEGLRAYGFSRPGTGASPSVLLPPVEAERARRWPRSPHARATPPATSTRSRSTSTPGRPQHFPRSRFVHPALSVKERRVRRDHGRRSPSGQFTTAAGP